MVLRRLHFVLTLWLHRKRLDKKAKVNFKTYSVTDWTKNNCNILPSILRSKDNQAMKLDQFIKHNMRKIFLHKLLLHLDQTKEIPTVFDETGKKSTSTITKKYKKRQQHHNFFHFRLVLTDCITHVEKKSKDEVDI